MWEEDRKEDKRCRKKKEMELWGVYERALPTLSEGWVMTG